MCLVPRRERRDRRAEAVVPPQPRQARTTDAGGSDDEVSMRVDVAAIYVDDGGLLQDHLSFDQRQNDAVFARWNLEREPAGVVGSRALTFTGADVDNLDHAAFDGRRAFRAADSSADRAVRLRWSWPSIDHRFPLAARGNHSQNDQTEDRAGEVKSAETPTL